MTVLQHDLAHEFPEFRDKIHHMKMDNKHFAKLFDEYHMVNSEVIRLEAENIPVTDETFESLKKLRLSLKDNLYKMLNV